MFRFKDIYYIFFLTSVIAAFIAYRKNPRHLRYFAWFLLVTFVLDLTGGIMARLYHIFHLSNHWVYNISISVEYQFLPWFYLLVLRTPLIRRIIKIYLIVFPFFILNNVLMQGWNTYNTFTLIAGGTFTIFLVVVYFYELLNNTTYINLFAEPLFWISVSLLFYHVGTVPYLGMLNFINDNLPQVAKQYYPLIVKVLNAVMYFLFTIAFLCQFNPRKSLS
jgi:hypothetical protein